MTSHNTPPLLTQRTAIIFIAAIFAGLTFGCCTFMAYGNAWAGVVAGLTAFGATVAGLHRLLE
jgi:hypothetical protein